MYVLVTFFHVVACLVLITAILLQSGRGGGLSEMLGGAGGQSQKLFGTQTSDFLTKGTTYCAIMFVITSVTLGILTSQKSKSIMESAKIKPLFSQNSSSELDKLKAQIAQQLDTAKNNAETQSSTEVTQTSEAVGEIAQSALVVAEAQTAE